MKNIDQVKLDFVAKWGLIGTKWGVNKTMGQIFALLTLSESALSTDEVMEILCISRGHANTSLRELVSWGIVTKSSPIGSRKEFFAAESDQWKVACLVAKARREKEIIPAIETLEETLLELKKLKTNKHQKFLINRLNLILEFMQMCNVILKFVSVSEKSVIASWVQKILKKF